MFTRREQQVIQDHPSPHKVQRMLNALPYNHEKGGGTLRTFRGVIRHRTAHCLEAALTAATILEQHGYPPLLLDLHSQDDLDHVVFLYRKRGDGRFGTIGRSRDPGLHGRRPVFTTLRQLVDSYADPFVDLSGRIVGYGVCDLNELGSYDWRLSTRNVWKVERHLIGLGHRTFHMADARYERWHRRYVAYRQRYPDRKPTYYPKRATWAPGWPRG